MLESVVWHGVFTDCRPHGRTGSERARAAQLANKMVSCWWRDPIVLIVAIPSHVVFTVDEADVRNLTRLR